MKNIYKIIAIYFMLISASVFAQNPLSVLVTGTCSAVSGTYNFNGIVNGKNQYKCTFNNSGIFTNVYVQFDGTFWILNSGEVINDNVLFANTNVPTNAIPPFTSWILASCPDGTITVSQILSNNIFDNSGKLNFQNPIEDYFSLQNKNESNENYKLEIYDLLGAIVKAGSFKYNENINVTELQSGIYIVKVTNEENKIYTGKLLKK